MSESKLGKLVSTDETARDAMHVAVVPVSAGVELKAGQHIRIQDGYAYPGGNTVGIVDPFLPSSIKPGDRFYLVVYPNRVTNLRHDWDHDAIPRHDMENELHDDYDDGCRGC